jgi:phosphocarrier protein HPr
LVRNHGDGAQMEVTTYRRVVTIVNPNGLHARPADQMVKVASRYKSRIEICKGHERVDGRSIISLLTLAAEQGTELVIEAQGEDAQSAVEALAELIAHQFHEAHEE